MCSKTLLSVLALAAIATVTSSARAGWITDYAPGTNYEYKIDFLNDTTINFDKTQASFSGTSGEHTNFTWAISADTSQAVLTGEQKSSNVDTDTHWFTDSINGDPFKNVTETLTNDSGVAWNGYKIEVASLTPGVSVKFTSASVFSPTTVFQDAVFLSDPMIVYSGSSTATPLADGATVDLKYTLQITPPAGYTGSIRYEVTMTPILVPEPASLALLGLGAAALLRRRR